MSEHLIYEILSELNVIKSLLIGVLALASIPIITFSIARLSGVRLRTESKGESYRRVAAQLLEHGEYVELIEYCKTELEKHPNSAISYWYIGRAHFEQGNYPSATTRYGLSAASLFLSVNQSFAKLTCV